jgi:hypothetical protein
MNSTAAASAPISPLGWWLLVADCIAFWVVAGLGLIAVL